MRQDFTISGRSRINLPLVAASIHQGHHVRKELLQTLALNSEERLYEEDPYTHRWTRIAPWRIVVHSSRFEVDMNRSRDKAVYRDPADAWGLTVWNEPPSDDAVEESLLKYDHFYSSVELFIAGLLKRFERLVVFDLHSYNYRRSGPAGEEADPGLNPDINVGTGSMDRQLWAPVVNRFISGMRAADFPGRRLDVRENVKFQGGYFSRRLHEMFPGRVCCLAIEVKKFFMNEWTGRLYRPLAAAVGSALKVTVPDVIQAVREMT